MTKEGRQGFVFSIVLCIAAALFVVGSEFVNMVPMLDEGAHPKAPSQTIEAPAPSQTPLADGN